MKVFPVIFLRVLSVCSAVGPLSCSSAQADVPNRDDGQVLISKGHHHRGPRGHRGHYGVNGVNGSNGINGTNGSNGTCSIASGQSFSLSPQDSDFEAGVGVSIVAGVGDAVTYHSDPLSSNPSDINIQQIPIGLTGAVVTSSDVTFANNQFTIVTPGTYLIMYGFTAVAGPEYIAQSMLDLAVLENRSGFLASPPTLYSYITPTLTNGGPTLGIGSVPLTLADIALKWEPNLFRAVSGYGQCIYTFNTGDQVGLGLVFQAQNQCNLHLNNSVFIDSTNRNTVGGTLTLIRLGS